METVTVNAVLYMQNEPLFEGEITGEEKHTWHLIKHIVSSSVYYTRVGFDAPKYTHTHSAQWSRILNAAKHSRGSGLVKQ